MPCSRRGSNPRPSHCFSTLGGYMAGTAYKYDALTDCATGARRKRTYCSFDVFNALTLNRFWANRKWATCTLYPWFWTNSWANLSLRASKHNKREKKAHFRLTCVAVKRCCLNSPISYQEYIFINLPSWFSVFSLFSYSFSCSCPNSEYFIYFFINLFTMIYFLYVHLFLAVVKSLCNHHMVHLPHYHTVSNSCRELEWDETLRFIYVYF